MLASMDALDNVAEASETLRDQLEAKRLAHAEARRLLMARLKLDTSGASTTARQEVSAA